MAFIHTRSMPNVRGLLAAMKGPLNGAAGNWALLFIAIAGIWYVSGVCRPRMNDAAGFTRVYCLCLVVSILISYYAYLYDLVLLALPLLLLNANFLDGDDGDIKIRVLVVCGVLLTLSTPVYAVLFYRLDSCYLLTVVLALVAAGLARVLRRSQNTPLIDAAETA